MSLCCLWRRSCRAVTSFLLTPVTNTISRTMEYEADMYGLNADPNNLTPKRMWTFVGEYRKLDPGPVEEFIFYDHPGGRTRITAAMREGRASAVPHQPKRWRDRSSREVTQRVELRRTRAALMLGAKADPQLNFGRADSTVLRRSSPRSAGRPCGSRFDSLQRKMNAVVRVADNRPADSKRPSNRVCQNC